MTLSYSAALKPTPGATSAPSLVTAAPSASPTPAKSDNESLPSTSSNPATASGSSSGTGTGTQHLILDAGPLLSLTPLRHLAQNFHTTPMVLAELRDPKAREHWQRLGLAGVNITVEPPRADMMARVVAFAKKTGDYAVLSQTDMSVIALTCQYEIAANGEKYVRSHPGEKKAAPPSLPNNGGGNKSKAKGKGKEKETESKPETEGVSSESKVAESQVEGSESGSDEEDEEATQEDEKRAEELVDKMESVKIDTATAPEENAGPGPKSTKETAKDDGHDSDDAGDWITPANVSKHRSRDLGLVPAGSGSDQAPLAAACMTGDYAVQNVLLSMGLGLIGEAGKRINKVKSFILRCHACFKTCNDLEKRFCPSCGNPTLLRTTVSTSAKTGKQTIHLKKNFQYHLRGSKFSIPDSKAGRAKGQLKSGNGLIMREDQREWQDAVRSEDIRRQKEEKKLAKGALDGWDNPDWLPEVLTVGMSGKGRTTSHQMPKIGHGRSNPNVARRKH